MQVLKRFSLIYVKPQSIETIDL